MLNVNKQVVAALKEIGLPVDYEMTISKGLSTPRITYYQLTNFVETNYKLANVSVLRFTITLWTHNVKDFDTYGPEIDEAMRDAEFIRVGSNELHDNQSTMMRMVMEYEARGQETFKGE